MLSQKHREEVLQYVPDDEIDRLYEACVSLFAKWAAAAPKIEDFDNPPGTDVMDKLIRSTLLPLANSGIEKSMSKLTVVSIWVFDPDRKVKDWADPEVIVSAVLFNRLGDSDTFLTELRDLKSRKETKSWMISLRDEHGTVIGERERTFPFWPLEERLGLDTNEKAFGYYLEQCKARGLA